MMSCSHQHVCKLTQSPPLVTTGASTGNLSSSSCSREADGSWSVTAVTLVTGNSGYATWFGCSSVAWGRDGTCSSPARAGASYQRDALMARAVLIAAGVSVPVDVAMQRWLCNGHTHQPYIHKFTANAQRCTGGESGRGGVGGNRRC